MARKIFYIIIIINTLLLISCNKKNGSISVSCDDIEEFESGQGIINVGQRSLGDIIALDTVKKRTFGLGTLHIDKRNIDSSIVRDSMVMLSASKFKIQFSGDIANAPENIKAKISSDIDNNTTFFLSNSIRKSFANSVELLNNDNEKFNKRYEEILNNNKNLILAVVTSMTYADKFEFRLKKSADAGLEVNSVTIGDYILSINYSCQNSLNIDGRQDGIFYKVSYFNLSKTGFIFTTKDIDLNTYRMAENGLE